MDPDLQLGRIGQLSRTVTDIAAARQWYADVLGLAHLYSFGDLAFFDCAGVRLFLSQGEAGPESIIYLMVDDVHAAAATLASRGVEFRNAPHMIHRHEDGTEEWMAFFNDPDSRPLALMSRQVVEGGEHQT
ncbi:VOC family protein [Sphingomonas aerophila]|uniref:Extradiol dioxygenase family protein n=1 Tax=Sphingomonas aerophila TaxID=1344948 RepID=A0A7W9EU89_9SPHN|nr:VOC family protein [Sphingomonas aerophila]MBB5713228.1 extradiol dioxygenase family protein [Sphingomonas aerophila]